MQIIVRIKPDVAGEFDREIGSDISYASFIGQKCGYCYFLVVCHDSKLTEIVDIISKYKGLTYWRGPEGGDINEDIDV